MSMSQQEFETKGYLAPPTQYFKKKEVFDTAVGLHFLTNANITTAKNEDFFVGLSHGQSPSGAYKYILDNYHKINNPEKIKYTFTNSRLKSQRDLKEIIDARSFLRRLLKKGHISRDQIFGASFKRSEDISKYAKSYNKILIEYLVNNNKEGYDFVFLASDPSGRVAAITKKSKAFNSKEIMTVVNDRKEKELTNTPNFLLKSKKIAFLATKSDKRRALAWLYSKSGSVRESPSFIRHINDITNRLTVFIDDEALTWPQIEIKRETKYGISNIIVDLPKPYNDKSKKKLPVILLIHGFLGLNSFDGLLTSLPTQKYIGAAMHYGSIPNELPPNEYSQHIIKNINSVVEYFGEKGHSVYIFDHSMGNIYYLMMDTNFNSLNGIKKYLKGRIGANPFFGEEAKHAFLGFLDTVILPSMTYLKNPAEKGFLIATRRVLPLDPKKYVRRKGIGITSWMIRKDSKQRDHIWQAVKIQILTLMSNLDSLPALNRIPVKRALDRLPAKVFAIQLHSALRESVFYDRQKGLTNSAKNNIPILILKSKKDGIAKYVSRLYKSSNVETIDVTNSSEIDFFREHLYHMVEPKKTVEIIETFIDRIENKA